MVKAYTEGGWRADAAVLDALAAVTQPPTEAVMAAIKHVYAPGCGMPPNCSRSGSSSSPCQAETCHAWPKCRPALACSSPMACGIDVGQKLRAALEVKVGKVQSQHQFVALPSVTPTAKPAVSPVAGKITGSEAGEEFRPCVDAQDGKDLTPDRFRKLLEDDGYQVLAAADTGNPAGRGWTEFGNLDSTGHQEGAGWPIGFPS